MNLRVGIVGQEPGWEQLLRREGIPYSNAGSPFASDAYAVLIVGDSAKREHFPGIRAYVNDGGAVLTSSKHSATLAGLLDKSMRVSSLVPSGDSEFASVGLLDIFGTIHVPERANLVSTLSGDKTVFLGREGSGHLMILPFDVPRLIADERPRTKSFYAPAQRLPFERVSAIAKGDLRMFVARCLELLYHRRGLPFAHVWYYPEGVPSVFAFRVDTDAADEGTIRGLYDLAHAERIPMTWFVHVERQRAFLDVFKKMDAQEVGIHCFAHRTFDVHAQILSDMRTAYESMRQSGFAPTGYAAPYGVWSRALGKAIAEMNFEYSSEFSLSYDDLPITPALDHGAEGVLQIPVHPVCLGTMRRHRYSEEQASAYFDLTLRRMVRMRTPAFFYHHPNDGHPEVLRGLFALVGELGLPMMTMGQFAAWWKKREQVALRAESGNDVVTLRNDRSIPEARVRISTPNGREVFVRAEGEQRMSGPRWNIIPDAVPFPKDYARSRRFNHRIPLVKSLDALTGLFKRKD